jgi:hypothetical protein
VIARVALLLLLPLLAHAQRDVRITETFTNTPLEKALKKISRSYDLKLAYDEDRIRQITVTATFSNSSVPEVLKKLLAGTGLTWQEVNGKYLIIPDSDSDLDSDSNTTATSFLKTISVSGMVKDERTGETLPNALIRIRGTLRGTTTNTDGYFTLLKVPADSAVIQVNYLGYESKTIAFDGTSDIRGLAVSLRGGTSLLDPIVVKDSTANTMQVDDIPGKVAFNPRKLASLPSLGEMDLFRTLQLMPGISGTDESSAGLIMRGSLPSQNLVLLDGFTIYHLDHFFGVFSALNADVIKDVQVFKSGYDARYGGRVSGVVDITGKSGNQEKPSFQFGANLMSIRATAEFPIGKKFSVLFAFRRAFTDIIQSNLYTRLFDISRANDEQLKRPFDDPRFNEIQPSFYFFDVNTKLTYRPSAKDILSLSIYNGKDRLFGSNTNTLSNHFPPIDFTETLDEHTDWGNNGASLRWGRQWNNRYYSNIRVSAADFFKDYGFTYRYRLDSASSSREQEVTLTQTNQVTDASLAIENEYVFSDRSQIDFGFYSVEHNINSATVANDDEADRRDEQGNVAGLYGSYRFGAGERFTATAGIRLNYHELNNEWYTEPRVSAIYAATPRLSLKASAGRYYQFVNQVIYDDPYNGIQNFWTFSRNGGVPVTKSYHYSAGFTLRTRALTFDAEGYYKDVYGLAELNPVSLFANEGLIDPGLLIDGIGKMSGIDFLLQKDVGKHKGWLGYSISRSLISWPTVDEGTYYPAQPDQRHEVKLTDMVTLGRWHLSGSWVFGSGRPYAQYDVLYIFDTNGLVSDFILIKDRDDYGRLPSYHRLDLAAAFDFPVNKGNGQVGLSIFNVYGHRNIKSRKVDISSLQSAIGTTITPQPSYTDLVLINFTPSLFITLSF